MKIVKYKKMSKGRYKIFFDNNSELVLYEDVILKNNLLREKNITLELLEKVMNENIFYEVYDLSLSYIEIKMRTLKELREYLLKKNFDINVIDNVLDRLVNEGYLDEKKYIDAYVNDKVNLTTWGPYKIKKNLEMLELDENLIEDKISSISDNVWKDKLEKIVNKKIKSMNNKSLSMIKNKLRLDLFNLGYDNSLIEEVLNNIYSNDESSIKKEYSKALNKYSKKYSDEKLIYEVKSYLYRKGYKTEDINYILDNLD